MWNAEIVKILKTGPPFTSSFSNSTLLSSPHYAIRRSKANSYILSYGNCCQVTKRTPFIYSWWRSDCQDMTDWTETSHRTGHEGSWNAEIHWSWPLSTFEETILIGRQEVVHGSECLGESVSWGWEQWTSFPVRLAPFYANNLF